MISYHTISNECLLVYVCVSMCTCMWMVRCVRAIGDHVRALFFLIMNHDACYWHGCLSLSDEDSYCRGKTECLIE